MTYRKMTELNMLMCSCRMCYSRAEKVAGTQNYMSVCLMKERC